MTTPTDDRLLTTEQAAQFLGVSTSFLAKARISAKPEISPALALRLAWIRERFGITGPYAKAICYLALGLPIDGGAHD